MDSNIYTKLASFKKPEIHKDASGYNYKYATLWQLQDVLKQPLIDSQLAYFHRTENNFVITRVYCIENPESFIESSIEIGECRSETIDKKWDKVTTEYVSRDPQMTWSAITYYRRYNLLQIFDLEIEDDDGNTGSPKAKAKEYPTWASTPTAWTRKANHECTKCWKMNEDVTVREWQYWPYFKCVHCDWFSKVK